MRSLDGVRSWAVLGAGGAEIGAVSSAALRIVLGACGIS